MIIDAFILCYFMYLISLSFRSGKAETYSVHFIGIWYEGRNSQWMRGIFCAQGGAVPLDLIFEDFVYFLKKETLDKASNGSD